MFSKRARIILTLIALVIVAVVVMVIKSNETVIVHEENDIYSCGQIVEDCIIKIDNVIPNGKTAKEISDIVFKNTLNKDLKNYKYITVTHCSQKKEWIINYALDSETFGGDISISLSQATGAVTNIWAGE